MRTCLEGLDEVRANGIRRLTFGDREIFAMPRIAVAPTIAFNHWYHHRGELGISIDASRSPRFCVSRRNPLSDIGVFS
jgi:hypothetical protein